MRFFVLLLILSLGLQAQPWEKPSASEGLVVWRSAAKVLSAGDEEALETVLGAINDSTSTQIVVLFVDRVKDDLNFVAAQTGEAWGIGQAETDNGMLVLIALEDRKMAIQVGRGLEPTITDLVSHQLIENTLKPAFRNQDYLGGVQTLAQEVAQRLAGQFDAAPVKEPNGRHAPGRWRIWRPWRRRFWRWRFWRLWRRKFWRRRSQRFVVITDLCTYECTTYLFNRRPCHYCPCGL